MTVLALYMTYYKDYQAKDFDTRAEYYSYRFARELEHIWEKGWLHVSVAKFYIKEVGRCGEYGKKLQGIMRADLSAALRPYGDEIFRKLG